jgi:hypothetical protein
MSINRNSSATSSVKWEVEFFPWDSVYPKKGEFGENLDEFGKNLDEFGKNLLPVPLSNSSGERISIGIKNLSFSRVKGQIDSLCSFTIIGTPPPNIIAGTWILISSTGSGYSKFNEVQRTLPIDDKVKNESVQGIRRIRFLGQITTVDYIYNVNEKGNITKQSVFKARPWSHSLGVPVRLDLFSLSNELKGGITKAVDALSQDKSISTKKIEELVSKSLNPFELVHTILAVIGAINQADALSKIDIAKLQGFPNVAVTMPSIPKALLNRLGFGAEVRPDSAFSTGFVKVVTGVQKNAINNDGKWNGVFGKQGNSISFIEASKNFDSNPPDRPATLGLNHIVQMGTSAWQLITSFCDPSVNEFFTDFIYDTDSDGAITVRPVLFVRDKPYSMRYVEEEVMPTFDGKPTKTLLSTFTKYDDLPRVRIPSVFIKNFSFTNTILNSPNYVRINFSDLSNDPSMARLISLARPPVRLDPEMKRFGGNEVDIQSNFFGYNDKNKDVSLPIGGTSNGPNFDLSPSNVASSVAGTVGFKIPQKFDFPTWVSKVKAAIQSWHCYDYRMLSGTLNIKDDNFAITVGFNVQFRIGEYDLVGHVEAVNTNVMVDGKGNSITNTSIQLSRIVMVNDENRLVFISPKVFGNLNGKFVAE